MVLRPALYAQEGRQTGELCLMLQASPLHFRGEEERQGGCGRGNAAGGCTAAGIGPPLHPQAAQPTGAVWRSFSAFMSTVLCNCHIGAALGTSIDSVCRSGGLSLLHVLSAMLGVLALRNE